MKLAIQCLEWFVISAVLMSFIEHQVHQRFMHRRNFLGKRIKAIKRVFESHAIAHHGHYSKIFSDEPVPPGQDRGIQLNHVEGFFEALPIAAVMALFFWPAAIIFETVVWIHHEIWNKIHLEMHKPEKPFFASWPVYKMLAIHHYAHHLYPTKNFNVVFPLADYVLGTSYSFSKAEMEHLWNNGIPTADPVVEETREKVLR